MHKMDYGLCTKWMNECTRMNIFISMMSRGLGCFWPSTSCGYAGYVLHWTWLNIAIVRIYAWHFFSIKIGSLSCEFILKTWVTKSRAGKDLAWRYNSRLCSPSTWSIFRISSNIVVHDSSFSVSRVVSSFMIVFVHRRTDTYIVCCFVHSFGQFAQVLAKMWEVCHRRISMQNALNSPLSRSSNSANSTASVDQL